MSAPRTSDPRSARQHLEGLALLGVDFVPLAAAPAVEAGGDAPASEAPDRDERGRRLEALCAEHDASCPHCTTAGAHTRTVFGEGNPAARLVFVGEAPGAEEDRTGRPFVGPAGQKLEEMIKAMGLERGDVYIANVLKSRPPNNRTPLAHEVEACAAYLARQLEIIRPEAIVALGGPAAKFLLETDTGITRLRGLWGAWRHDELEIPVMPTFHPAYLLRNYTRETRMQMWSDLKAVKERLGL